MYWKSLVSVGIPALATSLLLLSAGSASAGHGGGCGHGCGCGRGFWGCGVGVGVVIPVGGYGWGSGAFYPGASYGYNLDDRAPSYYGGLNYRQYYGYGMGEGYGFWLGPTDRYLPPDRYPPTGLYKSPWDCMPKVPPAPSALAGQTTPPPVATGDAPANIKLNVPAEAEVWLEGAKTKQTGGAREFVSPPLSPGENYFYEIRARWMENGQEVDQTRKVEIHAGDRISLSFPTKADAEVLPAPMPLIP